MAASQCPKVRLWRWRRNPLRRPGDLAEAWVLLTAWLLALVGGLIAGVVTARAIEELADRQRAEVREVSAVLVEDAENRGPARVAPDHRVWVTVRWTVPGGPAHEDQARVPYGTRAGSTVPLWTDGAGRITSEPLSPAESRLHGLAGGALAASGLGATVLGAAWVLRLRMEQRRLAQWDEEWERIDTRRGGKTG
ncbi:hypothetical protein [Streptomyces sp. S.PB5]|uniref:Rv1733c family protein n=1 Tax=Streptomyces sp. S.PB5 TaxID=3020844 RepID=UPI0025AF3A25|nr:hypothetical protein [Streptomyces sp. S.PB5]MDN3029272.1 hypothetical protein [Streptomyces sp. S.PB5]